MGYLGNDVLSGRGAADTLRGSDGEDQLFGGSGKDTLEGEADADSLFGGSGDDEIWGGNGLDVLTGGDGADNFRFKSTDVGADLIKDFQTGADELHIDRLLIGNALPAGELPAARFSEHGPNAFMGQFILVDAGEYDSLRWDANGMLPEDGTLEIARLWGESGLQASDILIV
jgi:Ca2+-binding RTX toxin-like protein